MLPGVILLNIYIFFVLDMLFNNTSDIIMPTTKLAYHVFNIFGLQTSLNYII